MEKVLGIIAEYNPFHNGHLHHLKESKKLTSCKYSIAVISGNFTQRGDTSIVDKWSKAKMALESGVDLVIELPVLYAVSSAENFAEGAVKILDSLKIVDNLAFGSETGNIDALNDIANVLTNEPKEYKNILSLQLNKGLSFPKARENALMMYLNDVRKFANVLSSPNNILGIEYLKALKKFKSNIIPVAIQRIGSNHNDNIISSNIASATAIRNAITNNNLEPLKKVMPESSFKILLDNLKIGHTVSNLSCFDKEILYNLRKMTIEEIADLPDVSEGLEYTIKKAANSCNSVVELLNIVNSKRYTKTRLQRILIYALLGITKKDIRMSKTCTPYIRVLGLNNDGKDILSAISNANPKLPIITSVKKFADTSTNKNLNSMIYKDIWATDVYSLGYEYDSWSNLDFTHKLITL